MQIGSGHRRIEENKFHYEETSEQRAGNVCRGRQAVKSAGRVRARYL